MLKRICFLLFLLVACRSLLFAGSINYRLDFTNAQAHYITVNVDVKLDELKDSIILKMPVWTPGSYLVREFSKNLESFRVTAENGSSVKWNKIKKNQWCVYSARMKSFTVSYEIYAGELSVRTSYVDQFYAYINGAGVFLFAEEFKNSPCRIVFNKYPGYANIQTPLAKTGNDEWTRSASNYDELIDSPVCLNADDVFTFDVMNIPHHLVMIGKANYDGEKLKSDFTKIIEQEIKIFGDSPVKEYFFFIINGVSSGGGLEHRNASSIMVSKSTYDSPANYRGLYGTSAHEYFHLWCGKRIRPVELGPFDYDEEVYTHQIWFVEGVTSFYDDLILKRAGFYSEQEYLDIIRGGIESMVNSPGEKIQPLAEASFDAWIKYYRPNENSKNATVSYYSKGSNIGCVLNLDILESTKGEKSLDDVMRNLYNDYKSHPEKGFTDHELQSAFEKVALKNYDDFFNNYIFGLGQLTYEPYLEKAGLTLNRTDGMIAPMPYLGATLGQLGTKLQITNVERNTSAWKYGLCVNDEITGVDDKKPEEVINYLTQKSVGDKVIFKVNRQGVLREIAVVLDANKQVKYNITPVQKPGDLQLKCKSKWLDPRN